LHGLLLKKIAEKKQHGGNMPPCRTVNLPFLHTAFSEIDALLQPLLTAQWYAGQSQSRVCATLPENPFHQAKSPQPWLRADQALRRKMRL